ERLYRTVKGSPLSDRREASPLLTEALIANLRQRVAAWRPESAAVVTDADLWLTPEQWSAARDRVHDLMTELHELARPPRTPGTVPIGVTLLGFEMRPATGPK
ncbi:MAG TPA: ArsR family transcriptional regulator, partial [Actinophytocola sp.]|nr:ArsR family transcriptional regulator [Actinophytocola sp.]